MKQEFNNIGVYPKGNKTQQKVTCPNCFKIGKKHYKDLCLSINLDTGLYNCHKCGWKGCVKPKDNYMPIKQYTKPKKNNLQKINQIGLEFLQKRGITKEVIQANKIISTKDGQSIVFPYFKDNELINYKTRGLAKKTFTQSKDSLPIIYNYDRVKNEKLIIICEGEMDSLSWEVAGITWHTSVNMGAPNIKDKNLDKKLECISNCYEVFEQAERVYIATDNDDNGRYLEEELVRRFGAEKCKIVNLKPHKDANEVLLKEGIESLKQRVRDAHDPKLEGIFTIDDIYDSMIDSYRNGQERGSTTHISLIDNAWTWRIGEVNIWTGYQNEGKSMFLGQLSLLKAFHDGWKFGVFSPENMPINDFYSDLIESYIGKSADPFYSKNYMNEKEFREGLEFMKKHFFVIYPKKSYKLDDIFDRAKFLVKTKGIRSLIIDPYNTVQHRMQMGEREDLYISRFMSQLKRFAVENKISVHLVAHQVTPQKDDNNRYYKPDVNRIKGGGTFADKCDNCLFIWRPNRALDFSDTRVIFGSQKIKKQKLVGYPQEIHGITYDRKSSRYYFNNETPFVEIDKYRCDLKQE
jgi:twinkle protein|tara:strand:+ start:3974 stop:5704 length:1731 start_codon:yes stop_codon:yes gene_type:complete